MEANGDTDTPIHVDMGWISCKPSLVGTIVLTKGTEVAHLELPTHNHPYGVDEH